MARRDVSNVQVIWRARQGLMMLLMAGGLALWPLCRAALAQEPAASPTLPGAGPGAGASRTTLNGETELARLVDLCAKQLGFDVEYDAGALRGTVTLRLSQSLSDADLWSLTNHVLATRGFTSVQMPGRKTLSIVPLAEATGLAKVQREQDPSNPSGFVTVVTDVKNRDAKETAEAIRFVLSRPGGSVTALGSAGLLLISDLKPRVDQALYVLELIDVPGPEAQVQIVAAQNLKATELAGLVTAAVAARDEITSLKLRGKITPLPDGSGVVILAPDSAMADWLQLVSQFDQRQAVVTTSYAPTHFAVREVSDLIEKAGRDSGPRGSGDRWKLVVDELTGTVIITATPSEQERIAQLLARLESSPVSARRQIRAFVIKNRPVTAIVDVLRTLIEAGVLDVPSSAPGSVPGGTSAGNEMSAAASQQAQPTTPLADTLAGPQTTLRSPLSQLQPGTGGAGGAGTAGARRDSTASATGKNATRTSAEDRPVTLTADEATNTIIAMGEGRLIAQLDQLIRQLDVRQPQVLLEVMVISLSDGQTLDLGVELRKLEVSGSTLISLASLFGLGGPSAAAAAIPALTGAGGTGVVLSPGDFSVLVRALKTINKGQSLSMPKVLVSNNQQAKLDSVLQQPFASTNASTTVATTSFAGTQDAGTTVTIKPQIAEGDHLLLDYSVALSTFVGESADPTLPPPRQQNSLASIVTIPDGFTVVVGGLELDTEAKATSSVPLLGSIPLLGEAFKSRSNSGSRSRFYVFIRANILRHGRFDDLKNFSALDLAAAGLDRDPRFHDWPQVQPRVIR